MIVRNRCDIAMRQNSHRSLLAFIREHRKDVLGRMIAKQLPGCFFMKRDPMLVDQCNKVRRCVAAKRRNAEVRVGRDEMGWLTVYVREITAAATRHKYFLADLVRTLEHDSTTATISCDNRTHETGGSTAQNDDVVIRHGSNITAEIVKGDRTG